MQTDIPLLFACMLVFGAGVWWLLRMAGSNVLEDDTDEFEPLGVAEDKNGRLVIVEED